MKLFSNYLSKLSEREKKLLIYGVTLIVIAMAWVFIYKPLTNTISQKESLLNTLKLQLREMKVSASQLKQMKSVKLIKRNDNITFISWIDNQLVKSQLSEFVSRSEPKDNQTLILTFENVVFDQLIDWLQTLSKDYSINISEADINLIDKTNGICNVRITLVDE